MDIGFGTRLGLFLLRVFVGVKFILASWDKIWPGFDFGNYEHGWLKQEKLKAVFEAKLPAIRPELGFYKDLVGGFFTDQHGLLTYAVVGGEMLVGIALVLGLLTRTASLFGAGMTAAFFLLTWKAGPLVPTAFGNMAFVVFLLCLVTAMSGAGLFGGLDGRIRRNGA